MGITVLISLLALVVGAIVTLSAAALQRKQMRQIELHREDPLVPLVPPPHPITRFLKRYGFVIINVCLNLGFLIQEMLRTGPITRSQVFSIALFTAFLFGNILFGNIIWVTNRLLDLLELFIGKHEKR